MSTTKTILSIVGILLIGSIAWYAMRKPTPVAITEVPVQHTTTQTQPPVYTASGEIAGRDSSDESITADMSTIDVQMNTMNADASAAAQ